MRGSERDGELKRQFQAMIIGSEACSRNPISNSGINWSGLTGYGNREFGTFYNDIETKDDLAGQVLDRIVHDCGVRNAATTQPLAGSDPAAEVSISIRLIVGEAASGPIWAWSAQRPDLLVDRVRDGSQICDKGHCNGIDQGFVHLSHEIVQQRGHSLLDDGRRDT